MMATGLELAIPDSILGRSPQVSIVLTTQDYDLQLTLLVGPSGQLGQDVTPAAGWPLVLGYGTALPLVSGTPFDVPAVPGESGNSLYLSNTSQAYSGAGAQVVISQMTWLYTPVLAGIHTGGRTSFAGPRSY